MYGFDSIDPLFPLSQTNEQGVMHVQFELRKPYFKPGIPCKWYMIKT